MSYLAPSTDRREPPNFRAARNRELSANPVYHYEGLVTDGGGVPLANAPVRITSTDCNGTWMTPLITYTDRNGEYQADTDFPVVKVEGSYFGHRTKYKWVGPPPSLPTLELPVMDGIQAPPAPTPPLMACRGPDGWVPQ
ncbi:MAG: carboxypeptidase-like regulatory domain-containing protein [Polyangiaceae bacterium]